MNTIDLSSPKPMVSSASFAKHWPRDPRACRVEMVERSPTEAIAVQVGVAES